jgi:membrane protein YqaA with SNARE-associated domain
MDPLFVLSLLGLLAMTFASSGVVPLPVSVVVLGLGYWSHPYWVIAVASIGSILGWFIIGNSLAKHLPEKVLKTAQKATPGWLRQLSSRLPFTTLLVINALPMPWDPIRLIQLAHGHPPNRMLIPIGIGRIARYSAIVLLSQLIEGIATLTAVILALLMVSIGGKIIRQLFSKWQKHREQRHSGEQLTNS